MTYTFVDAKQVPVQGRGQRTKGEGKWQLVLRELAKSPDGMVLKMPVSGVRSVRSVIGAAAKSLGMKVCVSIVDGVAYVSRKS